MQVIDEITRRPVSIINCKKVIVSQENGLIVYGYVHTKNLHRCVQVQSLRSDGRRYETYYAIWENMKDKLFFSNRTGYYMSKENMSPEQIIREMYTKGQGGFPYSFERRYEAIENFKRFEGRQENMNLRKFQLSEHMNYTFGLEFETSEGYVPENICYRDGLIPLRDGSISGLEYSTVVLQGNEGLSLLAQQINTLKRYTSFNKECSLHVHLGGFPLEPEKIWNLYRLLYRLQSVIGSLVPPLTFKSSQYKASGKDYCNLLPGFRNFDNMYESLVGQKFYGSLQQPHPNDIKRERKWQVHTRYYWVNFINMLCYDVNKTVEFRLLRPTYNLKKIMVWLHIFNALMKYAETHLKADIENVGSLGEVISAVYPEEIAEDLKHEIVRLEVLVQNQIRNNDNCGADLSMEDELFPESEIK